MAQDLEVGVDGYLIVVREPTSGFYAIYSKPKPRPQLFSAAARTPKIRHYSLKFGRLQTTRRASSGGLCEWSIPVITGGRRLRSAPFRLPISLPSGSGAPTAVARV